MGLIGDIAGAFGISKTGILAGALKMVGVPDRAAEGIALAAELSRGITKDGFDFDKVNKGALARHALKAFGVNSPVATLGLMAAMKMVPKGFLGGAGILSIGALAGPALAGTCAGGLAKSQLGIGSILLGLCGAGGVAALGAGGGSGGQITGLGATALNFLTGDKTSQFRNLTGTQRFAGGPGSAFAALPKPAFFEDIVAALMCDFIKDKQEEVENKLQDLQKRSEEGGSAKNQTGGLMTGAARAIVPGVGAANDAGTKGNQDSRNIEFEMIKNEIQKLSQMQQAMSNVLNTMNDQAMNAIRHIKAG